MSWDSVSRFNRSIANPVAAALGKTDSDPFIHRADERVFDTVHDPAGTFNNDLHHFWNGAVKGSKQLGNSIASIWKGKDSSPVFTGVGDDRPPPPPLPVVPGIPTIDDAKRQLNQSDRMSRRRGVLANIYGGGSSQNQPSVAIRTLLGQ